MNPSEIGDLITRLRAEGKALTGDGFGHVGSVKGQIKRVCVQLEELQRLLEITPPPVVIAHESPTNNPDCLGFGGDNVPGCTCRQVFDQVNRKYS